MPSTGHLTERDYTADERVAIVEAAGPLGMSGDEAIGLLGRDLKPEEARYVTEMVRRIAALVLMGPELDANYERVKSDVWEWGK